MKARSRTGVNLGLAFGRWETNSDNVNDSKSIFTWHDPYAMLPSIEHIILFEFESAELHSS